MLDRLTPMNMQDLEVFYHVVEKSSFLRAAEALHTDQGKVSRCVARLEQHFGAILLYRDMRTNRPTEVGKIVFQMAKDILERKKLAYAEAQKEHHHMAGSITLCVTPGFGNLWLIPRISAFLRKYPDIAMNFTTDERDDVNLMLGTSDIEIISSKPEFRESLEYSLLCEYPMYIYASQDYVNAHGTPQSLQDLDQHTIVMLREDIHPSVNTGLFNALLCAGSALDKRRSSIIVDNDFGVIAATASGLGLGFMPQFMGESSPKLQRIHLIDEKPLLSTHVNRKYIVYHKALNLSLRHRALVEFIHEQAKALHVPCEQLTQPGLKRRAYT